MPDRFSWFHEKPVLYKQQRPGVAQVVHTHRDIVPGGGGLAERVWCNQFQPSLLNFYFRISGFQSSLVLIYFCNGPNSCSHCTTVWPKTGPLCHAARRSLAPPQKSRRHNRSFVWTEALSGMIFLRALKLSAEKCEHVLGFQVKGALW